MRKIFAASAVLLSLLAQPVLANDKPGEGKTFRPILPVQIEEHFQHKILFHALQDLGYTIAEPNEAEYQTMHLAIGAGDAASDPAMDDFTTLIQLA